jgi:hypothetical protein
MRIPESGDAIGGYRATPQTSPQQAPKGFQTGISAPAKSLKNLRAQVKRGELLTLLWLDRTKFLTGRLQARLWIDDGRFSN